jgi:thiol-disulfide isomerase/thioredoxin
MRTPAILLAAILAMAPAIAAEQQGGVEVGQRPPEYLGRSTQGDKLNISDSAGKILIVSFWATWCPPCLKELPVLNAIQKQAGADRVRVIAINLEEPRRQFRKAMKAFEDFEITFSHDKNGRIAKDFRVKSVPNMFIVDVDGHIAFRHVGYSDADLAGIVADINSLLLKNQLH